MASSWGTDIRYVQSGHERTRVARGSIMSSWELDKENAWGENSPCG